MHTGLLYRRGILYKDNDNKAGHQSDFFYSQIAKNYLTLKDCLPERRSKNNMKSLARLYKGY